MCVFVCVCVCLFVCVCVYLRARARAHPHIVRACVRPSVRLSLTRNLPPTPRTQLQEPAGEDCTTFGIRSTLPACNTDQLPWQVRLPPIDAYVLDVCCILCMYADQLPWQVRLPHHTRMCYV